MIALGIDTSSVAGSVGLSDGSDLSAELSLRDGTTHSRRLLPSIHALLSACGLRVEDLDLVAVCRGPGSFTGLRIGMATARGLALATGRPVVGFSTLETIARACATVSPPARRSPLCVVLDAGKGEVYRGLFLCEGDEPVPLEPEAAMDPGEAVRRLPPSALLCGDGVRACRPHMTGEDGGRILLERTPAIGPTLAARAVSLAARVGLDGLPPLVPSYLRASEAEIHFKG